MNVSSIVRNNAAVDTMQGNFLVGWFDILGYKAIMDNNMSDSSMNCVVSNISKAMYEATQSVKDIFDGIFKNTSDGDTEKNKITRIVLENIKNGEIFGCSAMSDTIVFKARIDVDVNVQEEFEVFVQSVICLFFLLCCSLITYKMFMYGLPVRGAIDYGKCATSRTGITKESVVFMGKPFVNTHNTSDLLDFSGVTVCDNAVAVINSLKEKFKVKSGVDVFLIPAPVKGNNEATAYCLDWVGDDDVLSKSTDLRSVIFEKFSRFNKPVSPKTISKFENTEMSIRTLNMMRAESGKTEGVL